MEKKVIVHKKSKKYQSMLLFLAISMLIWLLSKLNETYNHSVEYQITYKNLAIDKVFKKSPNQNLLINLKANGYHFLSSSLTKNNIEIDLKYVQSLSKEKFYFLPNYHHNLFREQLDFQTEINYIKPDTLFFDFDVLETKKVEVKPAINYKFEEGYYLSNELKLDPSSVTISGPKSMLDTIAVIYTQDIELNKIKENFSREIKVNTSQLDKIKLSTKNIKITGKIEKFTEGKITVPITVLGVPKDKKIKTLQSSVDLIYKVSLSNFDKVSNLDFNVICDYSQTEKDSLNYLKPILKKQSNFVSDVQMNLDKIDFFIQ